MVSVTYYFVVTRLMSQSDKILKILKENPSSSSKTVWEKLGGKQAGSYRKTQRKLQKLHREGLVETHAIGREIVYSIRQSQTTGITDYFLTRFWNNLFEIQKELATEKPVRAYFKLRSLIILLPKEIKNEITLDLNRLTSRLQLNHEWLGVSHLGYNPDMAKEGQITHSQNLTIEVSAIVDKLASILHEKFTIADLRDTS